MSTNRIFCLLIYLLILSSCAKKSTSASPNVPLKTEPIEGTWYLQNTSDNYTFVRSKEEVGARRFYSRLIISSDGMFEWIEPGPTDKPTSITGTWKWHSDGMLIINTDAGEQNIQVIESKTETLIIDKLPK